MARAFLVVMDSVGIGGAPDSGDYFNGSVPDLGANTLGHILEACPDLKLPTLGALGLWEALRLSSGWSAPQVPVTGTWGVARETSRGKDTPSGHWELAGLPVPWDWHYFPDKNQSFPADLVETVCRLAGTNGVLGNCHASGTDIIARLGAEHAQSGWPICYTSADSVFQIAAHETHYGLERLYALCAELAPILHDQKVGRVIARPFVGSEGAYTRTANRKDFALPPPAPVLTEWVQDAGGQVHAIGKIGDIFSMRGIDDVRKGEDRALMGHLADLVANAEDGSLTFTNFVEFDSLYGHRRDPRGYADHLMWFDAALGAILPSLRAEDILVVTADHGNDPTWVGTDHTREQVPVLIGGGGLGSLGLIGFTGVAALVAQHLGVPSR